MACDIYIINILVIYGEYLFKTITNQEAFINAYMYIFVQVRIQIFTISCVYNYTPPPIWNLNI